MAVAGEITEPDRRPIRIHGDKGASSVAVQSIQVRRGRGDGQPRRDLFRAIGARAESLDALAVDGRERVGIGLGIRAQRGYRRHRGCLSIGWIGGQSATQTVPTVSKPCRAYNARLRSVVASR